MTIGLYFGSFNPVHSGHLIIASHIANYTDLQRIWFVISPQNPFKQESSLIAAQHRKHLIDLAIVSGKPKEGEPEFVDVVGQISLKSLEKTNRKRKGTDRNFKTSGKGTANRNQTPNPQNKPVQNSKNKRQNNNKKKP